MKKSAGMILAILFATLLFTACANEEEQITEKPPGKIDKITTKAADTMVKKIRTPMDKARLTQSLGDKRMEEMDKAVQNQ